MPAGAQARSSTFLRLFSTWFSTSSRLFSSLGLDFLSTFHYLRLDFSSTSPRLFSSLALVVLEFPSRKLTTFLVFPKGKL